MDEKTLKAALTTRTSKAGGTDSFVTPYRVDQASDMGVVITFQEDMVTTSQVGGWFVFCVLMSYMSC